MYCGLGNSLVALHKYLFCHYIDPRFYLSHRDYAVRTHCSAECAADTWRTASVTSGRDGAPLR